MSTFVSQFNPLLGKNEWVIQDENYDYHQEIARYDEFPSAAYN